MRKFLTLVCTLCASLTLLAQTQPEGIHPYRYEDPANVSQEHAHWSILPYVGVNWFFGDFNANEAKTTLSFPFVGFGAECAFNPAWSIGAEYGFNSWKLMGNPDQKNAAGDRMNADTLLLGNAHMMDIYLAADLINLIAPFAKKKPVALMISVGAGGAMHKNSLYYDMSEKNTAGRAARGQTALNPGLRSSMNKFDFNPFLKFGVNLEFNVNRSIALGIRAAYNLFMSDLIDGRQFNPNTDGLMDLSLNLRYKINAVKMTHARNVPGRDFPDLRAITTAEARNYVEDEVVRHVEAAYARGVEDAKVHDTLIIYHDTIIVNHDSVVYHDAISPAALAAAQRTNAAAVAADEQPRVYPRAAQNFNIYFERYMSKINDDGLIAIQQAAELMQQEPAFYALVIGYCDNTGTPASNYELGDRRSGKVAEELREEHGISESRIYAAGHGIVVGGRSKASYAPNRRVTIQLVDKATFDRRRAEIEKERADRNANIKAKATIVTEPSTSLAQLARKYYGNTHCWIYIYSANKSKLTSPNNIPTGIELVIPEITQEEMQVSKEHCQKIYNDMQR